MTAEPSGETAHPTNSARPLWPAAHSPSTLGSDPSARTQPCPQCGHSMPDLKGGKASICQVCGFKDSCCY